MPLFDSQQSGYKRYDFEVREGDRVRHRVERVALPNMAEAWAIVGDLSRRFDRPGSRIMVRDENGGVLIYVGAIAAQTMAAVPG